MSQNDVPGTVVGYCRKWAQLYLSIAVQRDFLRGHVILLMCFLSLCVIFDGTLLMKGTLLANKAS